MKKRVALLGIYHESNTFVGRRTRYEDFENSHLLRGQTIIDEYRHAHHEIGGMLASLTDEELEVIPVYFAEATPGGTISAECYERLSYELMHGLERVLPVDGVMVVVHGAAVSENFPDMDGHWLGMLRHRIGPSVPIVGTLDPHGNVSRLMADSTDALIAYRTNPHVDQRETGIRAGEVMKKILLENATVDQVYMELPLAISIEQQYTAKEPCAGLYRLAQAFEKDYENLYLSIMLGFPYADVSEMGMSLLSVSCAGRQIAESAAVSLREHIWNRRAHLVGPKQDIDGVLISVNDLQRPVLLLDMGDNIGGGSPGDSTYLLDALEQQGFTNACIVLCNPEACSLAAKYRIGEQFPLSLQSGNRYNRREPYQVQLISKQNGRFSEINPRHGGQLHYNMGDIVILKTLLGNMILLSSLRVPPFSSRQLSAFGLNPEHFDFIIAKGVNAPIAAFAGICRSILQVDTPGCTQADMTKFDHKNRRRPLFPFEQY